MTAWQIQGVFDLYFSYPVNTLIDVAYEPLEYPTITICNLNPVRGSQIHLDTNLQNFFLDQIVASKADIDECQLVAIKTGNPVRINISLYKVNTCFKYKFTNVIVYAYKNVPCIYEYMCACMR